MKYIENEIVELKLLLNDEVKCVGSTKSGYWVIIDNLDK